MTKIILILLISTKLQAQVIKQDIRPIDLHLPKQYNYCLYSITGTFLLNQTVFRNNEKIKYNLLGALFLTNAVIYYKNQKPQKIKVFERKKRRKYGK